MGRGITTLGTESPSGPLLGGQQDVDYGAVGTQMVIKILADSCAAAKLTEEHQVLKSVSDHINIVTGVWTSGMKNFEELIQTLPNTTKRTQLLIHFPKMFVSVQLPSLTDNRFCIKLLLITRIQSLAVDITESTRMIIKIPHSKWRECACKFLVKNFWSIGAKFT